MCNATSKIAAAAVVAASLFLGSCSDSNLEAARELCNRADAAVAAGDYAEGMEMLDTLDVRYRKYTDVRRRGMVVRERAIEGMTIDSISACDARLAYAKIAADSLTALMKFVDGPAGLEGYWVAASTRTANQLNANMVQGRVDPKGYFQLVANVNRNIGLNGLEFNAGGLSVKVGPVSDSRAVSVEGAQVLSFTQEDAADAMNALAAMSPDKLNCIMLGSKGTQKVALNAAETLALLTAWRYSVARQTLERTMYQREKLERRLAQTRNHLAQVTE